MRLFNKNQIVASALLVGIVHLILISPIIIEGSSDNFASLLILILCLLIGSALIPVVIFSRRVFLVALFGLIYYVYFLIMPAIAQISTASFYWRSLSSYDEAHVLIASFICLLGILGLAFGYRIQAVKSARKIVFKIQPYSCRKSKIIGILSLSFATISLLYVISSFDSSVLFSTRYTLSESFGDSDMQVAIGLMLTLPRAVAGTCLILTALAFSHCPKKCAVFFILVFIINAVVNFPGSSSRFMVGGILIASALVYVQNWDAKKMLAIWIAMVLLLFMIVPLWGAFNRGSEFNFDLNFISPYNYLLTGDLDGFQSIVNVVAMAEGAGHTFGLGLLSAILFFVPRSIWHGKAEPTGVLAAEFNGYHFTNISAPIFSEYYYDFGMVGLLVMCLITGYFVARMEIRSPLFSAIISGFIIIIMRGSLLAISRIPMTIAVTFFGLMFLADFIARSTGNRFASTQLYKSRLKNNNNQ